jgi:hypothetical protein
MFESLIAWLVATFLIGPLQSEIASRLEAGRAPAAVVQQMSDCAIAAGPALIQRAGADPVWAVSTAFGAWIGTTRPEAVLGEAAPACAPALAAARPFLQGG